MEVLIAIVLVSVLIVWPLRLVGPRYGFFVGAEPLLPQLWAAVKLAPAAVSRVEDAGQVFYNRHRRLELTLPAWVAPATDDVPGVPSTPAGVESAEWEWPDEARVLEGRAEASRREE